MLSVIRELLQKIINDIDTGNSNISEKDAFKIVESLKKYTDRTQRMSKYQACQYLNMSRATFDKYVREGLLPQGKKEAGFKEKFWEKRDLELFIRKRDFKKSNNCL